jgi:hypothetical protein
VNDEPLDMKLSTWNETRKRWAAIYVTAPLAGKKWLISQSVPAPPLGFQHSSTAAKWVDGRYLHQFVLTLTRTRFADHFARASPLKRAAHEFLERVQQNGPDRPVDVTMEKCLSRLVQAIVSCAH